MGIIKKPKSCKWASVSVGLFVVLANVWSPHCGQSVWREGRELGYFPYAGNRFAGACRNRALSKGLERERRRGNTAHMASSNASGESRNLVTSFMSCVESLLAEKEKRRDALSSMSTKMLNTLSSYKDMVSDTSFISTLSKRFSSIRQSITGRKEEGGQWEHALAQAEFRQKLGKDLSQVDALV